MEFEVLGPIRIRRDDGGVASPGRLQATLLGLLLAYANQPVSADRLVDGMWGETADARATHRLQTHVHRLRHALGDPSRLTADGPGYCLLVAPDEIDAQRFESLADEVLQIGSHEPTRAVELGRKALQLWRGDAYHGLDTAELTTEARRLADLKLGTLEELYAAQLSCGQHDAVAAALPPLLQTYPLRERLHELLMRAHAIAERQADALATYQHAHRVLVDELGVEPGPALQALQQQVLEGGAVTATKATGPVTADATPVAPTTPPPAQLPAQPGGFVGRDADLAQLDGLLDQTTIATVTGTAGVGKSALTLHWAHRSLEAFSGGQLDVDLRGFGPQEPLQPTHALAGFLRALGVETHTIPFDPEERASMFRSHIAGRRMLLVLDNARNVAQVRPLLPGTDTCAVVVTSRNDLAGLSVHTSARHIGLQRLAVDEARTLVNELIPDLAEADAVHGLVETCSRLPLALRVAAERMRRHGHASVTPHCLTNSKMRKIISTCSIAGTS